MIESLCLLSGRVACPYNTPQVEVIDLQTEKGFATSTELTIDEYDTLEEIELSL